MEHASFTLDKQGYMHTHALAPARTHLYDIYLFFTATMLRERALVLRYAHIACLVPV
jgi:hypothetical protein